MPKFEKQFNRDMMKQGKLFARGYLILIFAELVIIGIDYLINRNQRDLVVFVMTAAQLLLGLFQRFVVLKWNENHFNLFLAIQNLGQALLNCLAINLWLAKADNYYVNNLSYSANIIVKHLYLLQGSSITLKFFTGINLCIIYLIFFLDINSSLRHYITSFLFAGLMHIYKLFLEDRSLRNLFLVQRSEDEMNFLIKRLLPVSMLICRYDKKEERIYFHMSNTKLQKQFHIKDDDSMKNFFLKVELQALDEQQRQRLESNNYQSLFQHLHLQAKQHSKKHSKKKQTNNHEYNPVSASGHLSHENSLPLPNNGQQAALFSQQGLNMQEDLISPNSISHRQSQDLTSHRNQTDHNTLMKNAGVDSDVVTQKLINSIRKNNHKKTIIKQFDNLTLIDSGDKQDKYDRYDKQDKQYEQTILQTQHAKSGNNNANGIQGNQQKNSSTPIKDLNEEIYDRLEVFYGILQGDNQKVLNIKIYTYILEEIYQVIIFEDETLQSRVEYLQKLNKYYTTLFDQMLKKLRAPIAQNLYKMKKAVNNLKQTNLLIKQQQSFNTNYACQDSVSYGGDHQNRIREITSDIHFRKQNSNNIYIANSTTNNEQLSKFGTSLLEDMMKQEQQTNEMVMHAQDLQYSNYNILNNLFNYQDIFLIFQKGQINIYPINISLERIIKDLKSIFCTEYKSRDLDLYFINDLQDEESYINTDEKYLKQVFINLINNSLQILTKVQKGKNQKNDQVIDVSIVDTGPGFESEYKLEEQIVIQNLNILTLQKNLNVRELKLGIPISQKIVGKLGPYEKIKYEKNVVSFQIFKDYQGLIKNKDQQEGFVKRKSLFIRNKSLNSQDGSEQLNEDDDIENQQNDINFAIQKQQIEERNEMIVFGRHQQYFIDSALGIVS